ncbi:hypothetical protein EK904_008405, partial [Melospiza melodia maxima]
ESFRSYGNQIKGYRTLLFCTLCLALNPEITDIVKLYKARDGEINELMLGTGKPMRSSAARLCLAEELVRGEQEMLNFPQPHPAPGHGLTAGSNTLHIPEQISEVDSTTEPILCCASTASRFAAALHCQIAQRVGFVKCIENITMDNQRQ